MGVDVGGTKTLIAALNGHGEIVESRKIPTMAGYKHFLLELRHVLAHFEHREWQAAAVALPAAILDREHSIGVRYGNLHWHNTPVGRDLEALLHCPVLVENDAKLACLSEAMLRPEQKRVLYVTVSTGIGFALCVDRQIDRNIGDGGGRTMYLPFHGKLTPWEDFASGRAIVERYHKLAQDITSETTWRRIAHDLAGGFIQLIAITEPDVVVVGGSVGSHFDHLQPLLTQELQQFATPTLNIPPIEAARRPEEAVAYGCYDFIMQALPHHATAG